MRWACRNRFDVGIFKRCRLCRGTPESPHRSGAGERARVVKNIVDTQPVCSYSPAIQGEILPSVSEKGDSIKMNEESPADILTQFVGVFEGRGLLNQCIRIKHRDRRYWISCSETRFLAYRMNDHCSVSPGVPGWPVCIVKCDTIINDSDMSSVASTEPSASDWFHCIVNNDFEVI
jgi:hypothetical protein